MLKYMCIFMYMYSHIYIYIHIHTHMYIYTYIYKLCAHMDKSVSYTHTASQTHPTTHSQVRSLNTPTGSIVISLSERSLLRHTHTHTQRVRVVKQLPHACAWGMSQHACCECIVYVYTYILYVSICLYVGVVCILSVSVSLHMCV